MSVKSRNKQRGWGYEEREKYREEKWRKRGERRAKTISGARGVPIEPPASYEELDI